MSPRRPYLEPLCRKDGTAGVLRRRQTFGQWRATYQCPKCGRALRTAKLGHPQRLMDLPIFERVRRERKPNARGRAFAAFLRTRVWREQSQRIQRRDRFRCRLRLPGCTFRSTTAHHLTYERFGGDERDSDLVAACRECNLLERERRITRRVLGG